jgi:signal transduction histidine kinase
LSFTSQGSIQISVEKSGSDVIVTVRDTGRGIDSDILPRLFEKFVTKSEKGTGLGLFISKSIIEAHGGRIWAENNKDGKGASLHFSLPVK